MLPNKALQLTWRRLAGLRGRSGVDREVLVSAIRSRRGASFRVLEQLGAGRYEIAVSVPLVLEYEDALLRQSNVHRTS